jgi:hypothetical protein
MADVQTSEKKVKLASLNMTGQWNSDRSSEDEQLLIRPFLQKMKNTNMVGGWNLKLTFCFMETTPEPLHLRQMKFGTMKDHGHTYKFCLNNHFLGRTFWTWQWWDFLNYCSGCKTCTSQCGTMKFCMLTSFSDAEKLLTRPKIQTWRAIES